MKTLIVSLAVLAAVSSAALASERGHVPDSVTHFGARSYATEINALIVLKSGKKPAVFEIMNNFSEEYKMPGKDNKSKH